jgi:hypothetical protein
LALGLYDHIDGRLFPQDAARALLQEGRLDELGMRYPDDPDTHAGALAYAGRIHEALAVKNLSLFGREKLLVNAGRPLELAAGHWSMTALYVGNYEKMHSSARPWAASIAGDILGLQAWRMGMPPARTSASWRWSRCCIPISSR